MSDPMDLLTPWFVQDHDGRSVEIAVQSNGINYDPATDQMLSVDIDYIVTLHENLYSGRDQFGHSVASHSYEAATLAEAIAGALAQRNDWALLDGQDAAEVPA